MTKRELTIAEKISHRIKRYDPSAEIFLFGSRARGDAIPIAIRMNLIGIF